MAQFIEKATPKLLDAMKEHISKHVEDQVGGLRDNTQKMLDQLKDTKREGTEKDDVLARTTKLLESLTQQDAQRAAVVNGVSEMFKGKPPVRLTREQARDPKLYRAAKAQADADGTRVEIVREG